MTEEQFKQLIETFNDLFRDYKALELPKLHDALPGDLIPPKDDSETNDIVFSAMQQSIMNHLITYYDHSLTQALAALSINYNTWNNASWSPTKSKRITRPPKSRLRLMILLLQMNRLQKALPPALELIKDCMAEGIELTEAQGYLEVVHKELAPFVQNKH